VTLPEAVSFFGAFTVPTIAWTGVSLRCRILPTTGHLFCWLCAAMVRASRAAASTGESDRLDSRLLLVA